MSGDTGRAGGGTSKAALGLVRLQNVLAFKPMMKGVNYSLAIYAVALTYPLYPIVTANDSSRQGGFLRLRYFIVVCACVLRAAFGNDGCTAGSNHCRR